MLTRRITVSALALIGCGSSAPAADGSALAQVMEAGSPDSAVVRLDTAGATDAGPGDAGPPATSPDAGALFAGCPGPEAYVGNPAWRDALVIGAGARLCSRWVESNGSLDNNNTANSLRQTLARKVMSSVAAGTYKLPAAPGQVPFGLPVCLVRPDRPPVATGTGTIARGTFGAAQTFQIVLPITGMGLVRVNLLKEGQAPLTIEGVDDLQHCPDGKCDPGVGVYFSGCFHGGTMLRHMVSFEGGTVELLSTIDSSGISAGTEAGDFHRASGTFRGASFDQRDYFKLIYSPEHHHFIRNYAVLFDAPIGGACGLEVVNLPGDLRKVHAYAVDCQLGRQSELAVTGVKLE
jgi:hypothetical protein